ncbi:MULTISPECIES: hypothetical protein [Pseudomonas]|uniref:hypothetical protein n=1 Tax=Pseudomonas TaxID=286 RepID=UPI001E3993B9|nr:MULTISPECIES: hypothetical protein [Pseudomonas]MCE1117611.1 hypothetical protein [Pseudomonas sp. NMI795_08]
MKPSTPGAESLNTALKAGQRLPATGSFTAKVNPPFYPGYPEIVADDFFYTNPTGYPHFVAQQFIDQPKSIAQGVEASIIQTDRTGGINISFLVGGQNQETVVVRFTSFSWSFDTKKIMGRFSGIAVYKGLEHTISDAVLEMEYE